MASPPPPDSHLDLPTCSPCFCENTTLTVALSLLWGVPAAYWVKCKLIYWHETPLTTQLNLPVVLGTPLTSKVTPAPCSFCLAWLGGPLLAPAPFFPRPFVLSPPSLTGSGSQGSAPRPSLDLFYTLQAAVVSLCIQGTRLALLLCSSVTGQVSGHRLASSATSLWAGTQVSISIFSKLQNPIQCLAYRQWVLLFCFQSEWINRSCGKGGWKTC